MFVTLHEKILNSRTFGDNRVPGWYVFVQLKQELGIKWLYTICVLVYI